MKIKTSELTDLGLDWAVAKCKGIPVTCHNDGITRSVMRLRPDGQTYDGRFNPSTCWAQGGPIIRQEITRLDLVSDLKGVQKWNARRAKYLPDEGAKVDEQYGPTPLIAICRCYVASLLGDEVDVPEELL